MEPVKVFSILLLAFFEIESVEDERSSLAQASPDGLEDLRCGFGAVEFCVYVKPDVQLHVDGDTFLERGHLSILRIFGEVTKFRIRFPLDAPLLKLF